MSKLSAKSPAKSHQCKRTFIASTFANGNTALDTEREESIQLTQMSNELFSVPCN